MNTLTIADLVTKHQTKMDMGRADWSRVKTADRYKLVEFTGVKDLLVDGLYYCKMPSAVNENDYRLYFTLNDPDENYNEHLSQLIKDVLLPHYQNPVSWFSYVAGVQPADGGHKAYVQFHCNVTEQEALAVVRHIALVVESGLRATYKTDVQVEPTDFSHDLCVTAIDFVDEE